LPKVSDNSPAMHLKDELTVWTVGHSTRPLEVFLDLLAENSIEGVADIRSFPGSRRYPQYNQDALRHAVRESGSEYGWFAALGGRRRPRADSTNTSWRNASFRGYADYMQTPPFAAALEELMVLASEQRTTLMCSEAVWWRCHRALVADALKAGGIRVLHIMGPGSVTEHPFTAPARFLDGALTYGAAGCQARASTPS
jgi:uncharacterized protein (DUF488 family)